MNTKKYCLLYLAVFSLLFLRVDAVEIQTIQPAASLPATTPWDLKSLSHPPKLDKLDKSELAESTEVRSLYFRSEMYQGKPTRVFGYYATPGTLAGDLSKEPENLHFVPNLKHGHVFDRPKAIEVFMAHHLKQEAPLAKVASVKRGATQITAEVKTSTPLLKAQLHYTAGELAAGAKDRKWLNLPATIDESTIQAPLPPDDTTAWFLTVEDTRKTVISSLLVFPGIKEATNSERQ